VLIKAKHGFRSQRLAIVAGSFQDLGKCLALFHEIFEPEFENSLFPEAG